MTYNESPRVPPFFIGRALPKLLIYLIFWLISLTVRKRRDPAILDREELFLQLEIEEIFFSEEFSNPNFKDHS